MVRSLFANASNLGTPPPRAPNLGRGHRSATQLTGDASSSPSSGRRCQVILLDDRKLDFLLQPKLTAGDLLDLVTSHFNLKEKEYFSLAYRDETGHYGWLQNDRRVLDHDFPNRPPATLYLYFLVRFYVESITHLQHATTVELFYLQAKSTFSKGLLECEDEKAVRLCALGLQVSLGDYPFGAADQHGYDAPNSRMALLSTALNRLDLLPPSLTNNQSPNINERPSPAMENVYAHILRLYQGLLGQPRGQAIVSFMAIAESLPTYGVHYYEVRDKHGTPWWLGLSPQGIAVYPHHDRRNPRRMYQWRQLENLYFREKKFSVEIHDQRRSNAQNQGSKGGSRTFGPSNVNVHVWFAATPTLCKTIWSMAICQHQFYLDRKTSKSQLNNVRSLNAIAAELSQSSLSLASSGGSGERSGDVSHDSSANNEKSNVAEELLKKGALPRSCSTNSLPGSVNICPEETEASSEARRDMHAALKARKVALEESLKRKMEELKKYCIQEAEITGQIPVEISQALGPGEEMPPIRRRVGTAYAINERILKDDDEDDDDNAHAAQEKAITELELQYEIQKQITNAALRLASDPTARRAVRNQHRNAYEKACKKLKEIEHSLNDLKKSLGKTLARKDSYDELDDEAGIDAENETSTPPLPPPPPPPQSQPPSGVNFDNNNQNIDVVDYDERKSRRKSGDSTGAEFKATFSAVENHQLGPYQSEVPLGPEHQYPGQMNSSPSLSSANNNASYSTQNQGLVKQCSAPALSSNALGGRKAPPPLLQPFPEDESEEASEKAMPQESLNLSLDTVDVIDLSLNSSSTNHKPGHPSPSKLVTSQPYQQQQQQPVHPPSSHKLAPASNNEMVAPFSSTHVTLRQSSNHEISDTVRALLVDPPTPSSLMPLTPPAMSTGIHHRFPTSVMHQSLTGAGVGGGATSAPLQQLLYGAAVGQYDCGSRTRASLAQAADGSLDETMARQIEMLSVDDSSSSASSGQRDDVASLVSSSSDDGGNHMAPLSSTAPNSSHDPPTPQVAVTITRGACLPPAASAVTLQPTIAGPGGHQGSNVGIPVLHSRVPQQGAAFSHGETTLDRFHRQATSGSAQFYSQPAVRSQPPRSATIELPVEHVPHTRTSPRPASSHHSGGGVAIAVSIQSQHQLNQVPPHQLQQLQQQYMQHQYQQQLQAGDRRSYSSNHSSSSERSANNNAAAAIANPAFLAPPGNVTPLSASRQYRRVISSEAAESVAERLARLSSSIQELQKDVTDAQKVRLLTSGFAISPSRPQTPRGTDGGSGFSVPLSLPPGHDRPVVNPAISPRGPQRGVVGYATVQSLGTPHSSSTGQAGGENFQPFKETSKPFEMADVYKYSSRFRPGPTSPSVAAIGAGGGSSAPRTTANHRGASAPPERKNPQTQAPPPDRKAHVGVPLTAPGLSGSADATGATTTIRVGGSSGNNPTAYAFSHAAPTHYDSTTMSTAPIRRLRDPSAGTPTLSGAANVRSGPQSSGVVNGGSNHRRAGTKGSQQANLARLTSAPVVSAQSNPNVDVGPSRPTTQVAYPTPNAPFNGVAPSSRPQPSSANETQRSGIPKRNPNLPPNEQGLFPQGAVLPRSPAMMQLGTPASLPNGISSSTPPAPPASNSSLDSFAAAASSGHHGGVPCSNMAPVMTTTFSDEMIAWYADRENQGVVVDDESGRSTRDEANKQATLV